MKRENTSKMISSLQAILGHLWKSIVRNQNFSADQEIHCVCLVNMRHRLEPPLEKQYFGNIVTSGRATTTAGEILKQGIGFAALEINKTVALQNNEEATKQLLGWVEKPVLVKISGRLVNNSLVVASSPRFNVYGNDFGWGSPLGVRGGVANIAAGKIIVFPGLEEGSVDFQICLDPETMQALGNDAEFMNVFSS